MHWTTSAAVGFGGPRCYPWPRERKAMADVTVKSLDEFEAVFGGGMRRVRAGLGVSSFGMQVIELPPGFDMYPDHDHLHDEQEEVYVSLGGTATLKVGEEAFELSPGEDALSGKIHTRILHHHMGLHQF